MPNEDWERYTRDPRTKCKYGEKCYQKNPDHHKTYKHPPQSSKAVKHTREQRKFSPFTRKPKEPDTKTDKPPLTEDKTETLAKDKEITEKHELNKTVTEKDELNKTDHPSSSNNNVSISVDFKVILPLDPKYYNSGVEDKILKELFLVDMPTDFYKFYEYLNKDGTIEKLLASVNLQLIGPYDLLLGKLPVVDDKDLYLVHWRFFFDPPEFQAVLKKKGASQFHFGYYRDSPEKNPVFVASNDSEKDYKINPVADNIFGAVYLYLQNEKNKSPFTAMACQRLMDKVKKGAEEAGMSIKKYTPNSRPGQVVAKTLHGAGIVVPYVKQTQLGYRFLVETDENLKKIFTKIEEAKTPTEKDKALSELQPVITYASIAVDECDFGTGLEAGIDLFCSGLKELHSSTISSLNSVYGLLNREAFGKIIMAHLKYRRKGANLSILDFK